MLDPLPPDIRFEPLSSNPADLAFSFAAKKEAGAGLGRGSCDMR
jgi:hypothetical protein